MHTHTRTHAAAAAQMDVKLRIVSQSRSGQVLTEKLTARRTKRPTLKKGNLRLIIPTQPDRDHHMEPAPSGSQDSITCAHMTLQAPRMRELAAGTPPSSKESCGVSR